VKVKPAEYTVKPIRLDLKMRITVRHNFSAVANFLNEKSRVEVLSLSMISTQVAL